MTERPDPDRVDVPPPTIVGPRPEAGTHGQTSVPRGLERLLALAGLHEDWKRRTLEDPLGAAADARIELTPSESAILKSIPRPTLGQMILSFARTHLGLHRETVLATGAAAAALLSTVTGEAGSPATEGIRPDIPPSKGPLQEAPASMEWEHAVDMALAKAAASTQAVMVVCPMSTNRTVKHNGPPGSRGIMIDIPHSPFLKDLHKNRSQALETAIRDSRLIAVQQGAERHDDYVAMLEKYGVADVAPLVFFLAPDGILLGRVVQPVTEDKLIEAIRGIPPRLSDWVTRQRPEAPPPSPATKGIR